MEAAAWETYTGLSPRPADFDAYWEEALDELRRTDPQVTLEKSSFQAPNAVCYDLWFTGVRGARIHAKYLRPAEMAGRRPAVLRFHGYSLNAGDWWDKLAFVAGGFCFAAMDCRGQSGYSQDTGVPSGSTFYGHIVRGADSPNPQDLLMRHIFLDTVQLARIVGQLDEVDETKMAAIGGSQAGGLSLACAALSGQLNRIAVVAPFLCDYREVYKRGFASSAYSEIWEYFRKFDPRHQREEEFFNRLGYIDVLNLADRITAKTLLVSGLRDDSCPCFTHFAAYNRIPAEKSLHVYPDFWHEPLFEAYDDFYRFLLDMYEEG